MLFFWACMYMAVGQNNESKQEINDENNVDEVYKIEDNNNEEDGIEYEGDEEVERQQLEGFMKLDNTTQLTCMKYYIL